MTGIKKLVFEMLRRLADWLDPEPDFRDIEDGEWSE